MQSKLADRLWGQQAKFKYLFLAALLLLFGMLGSRELWTQEHRWADIVTNMFYYHDFLHPMLEGDEYYDKPLLSYWLIAAISFVTGQLNALVLRIPSALAGLLAIWSIYSIGTHLKDKRLGLLSAWMMLTAYYFAFWARISSADMLNLAGSLFAVAWYVKKRESTRLYDYMIFFLILSLTASCKGLVGPIVTFLVILPDLISQHKWKQHLNRRLWIAMIPAVILYVLPFLASSYYNMDDYDQSGLYQVYRENITRYFQPFDHKGSIYTYFIYLPVYLFPWVFFFIPTLFYLKSRWKTLSNNMRWMSWASLAIFLFFTLSGSRRGYYILPMIPYAILMTADWILSSTERNVWAARTTIASFLFLASFFLVAQPLYYSHGGVQTFDHVVKKEANKIQPWSEWKIMLLDAETKLTFYMHLSPELQNFDTNERKNEEIDGDVRKHEIITQASLLKVWPVLKQQPNDTILITRRLYVPLIADLLKNYTMVEAEPTYLEKWFNKTNPKQPVAFIPKNLG